MFRVAYHDPRLNVWQSRLSRVPRWGWIAIGVGVVLPVAALLTLLALSAVAFGIAAFLVVLAIVGIRNAWRRLTHRSKDDGRRNVKIVVHQLGFRDE